MQEYRDESPPEHHVQPYPRYLPLRIEDQAIIDLEAVPQPRYLIKRGAAAALVYSACKLSLKLTFGVAGQLHYVFSQIEMVKG